MRRNGSPSPRFDTDAERTYFLAELPIHPAFRRAEVEAGVELNETEAQVLRAVASKARSMNPRSPRHALLGPHGNSGKTEPEGVVPVRRRALYPARQRSPLSFQPPPLIT